ncbi:MAG: hypothetical protein ACREQB_08535 [Candidatus Binataceae bacterium]
MRRLAITAFLLAFSLAAGGAPPEWKGGLWVLDYPENISIYGYFRLQLQPDASEVSGVVLRVEWVETQDGVPDRIFASRLIPELSTFFSQKTLRVEIGPVPDSFQLTNAKGKRV